MRLPKARQVGGVHETGLENARLCMHQVGHSARQQPRAAEH